MLNVDLEDVDIEVLMNTAVDVLRKKTGHDDFLEGSIGNVSEGFSGAAHWKH